MSVDTVEISKLANILQQNGDKVLNGLSKLALNGTLLQRIIKEFEIVFQNGNQDNCSSFQVLTTNNSNSQLIQDLQFLHDFFQKTIGLKLTNSANLSLLNNKIDISKFKNIKYLEIKKIPIKEIIGLKVIQSQLESIICVKCLSMLEDLLAECGGDNTSGFVWSELKEAVLSYNNIKIVDTSVAFAPWLQVLDLSHNQITDVKAIECLPNLKYINLSFNCLDVIPTFSKSARKKMQVLVMKNNYVEDLTGLSGLDHLNELDLSCNWISSHDVLHPLLTMSNLQWLSLEGNPISFHNYYRANAVGYLHINASFGDFILDKVKLTKHEKSIVGIRLCGLNRSGSGSFNKKLMKESPVKTPEEEKTEEKTNSVRKSGKVRLAVIPNLDDGTYEELPPEISNVNLLGSSAEHLITKKQIEKTRATFGSDNWLRCEAGSVVQDILGLPSVEITSSTPYDDLCLEAAMDSVKNVVTTKAVIETHEQKLDSLSDRNEVNLMDSFNSCVDDNASNYFSIENSTDKIETSESNCEETITSKETSPDIEPIQDSEEETEEEGEKLYLVTKEVKLLNNEFSHEEIFLTISDAEMKEKEPNRGKTITKWSLSSLESCIKLSPTKLQIVFDTIRRDKKERIYNLDVSEAQALHKRISQMLEDRTLSDMNQIVLRCVNCSSQFTKEIKSRKSDKKTFCPFCSSEFVLQVEEDPLPSSVIEKKAKNKINETKKIEVKSSHNRSSSAGVIQYDDKIVKCPSRSSIGEEYSRPTLHSTDIPKCSAASLDELNELPLIQNNNVKRSDSDIEILSNPSQSSIEVIDGPAKLYGGNTPRRKRSSEERQSLAPVPLIVPENLSHMNNLTGLTESSSSGSITDSICTAYENSSMVTSGIIKGENVEVVLKETEEELTDETMLPKKNFEEMLEEVIENVSAKIPKAQPKITNKSSDKVQYSFTNFSKVDHRIKLFLYSKVFEDNNEELVFLLRGTILLASSDIPQPSCIVASNKKLYLLKVTGIEEGYEASKFLQKVDSLTYNLNNVKYIYTLSWHQGFGVKIEEAHDKIIEFLILLKDVTRTKNFLSFLTSSDINFSNDLRVISECLERPYLAIQHVLLSGASEDPNISYFCLFSHLSVIDDPCSKEINTGGILTNKSDLLLFTDRLKWFFDGSDQTPVSDYSQKLSNLMQVDVDESKVILHFLNEIEGKEELWSLIMETEEAVKELLNALKAPWEEMFSVPLQISSI